MKKTTLLHLSVYLFICLSVTGCYKDNDSISGLGNSNFKLNSTESALVEILNSNNVTSEDGVLYFPSFESFNNTIGSFDNLSNNNDVQLTSSFYTNQSYTSFDYLYKEGLRQLSETSTEEEFEIIKETLSESIDVETLSPRVVFSYITPFLNKDRIINIEGSFYHYGVYGVGLSKEFDLDGFREAERTLCSTEEILYYEPQQRASSRNCTISFYDFQADGKRAGRASYEVIKDIQMQQETNCDWEVVFDIFTQKFTTKWVCRTTSVPTNVVLSVNVAGLAFKRSWFSWNTYNTGVNLNGNMNITSDGVTYQTAWNKSCGSCSNLGHRESWFPNAVITNPGSANVDNAYLFFDTRGLSDGNEIIYDCN